MTRRISMLFAAALLIAGCADTASESTTGESIPGESTAGGDSTAPAAPATTTTAPTPATAPDPATPAGDGVQPDGFTTVQARITAADGEVCEVCLWLADESSEWARGLMGVTDLGDAAGMVFQFDSERNGFFYMFQTPTPLSIAWFDADGEYVDATDMEPCLDTAPGDCPLYGPDSAYATVIEVFAGDLEQLGIGPGSSVALIEGSEAARCPTASSTL